MNAMVTTALGMDENKLSRSQAIKPTLLTGAERGELG
jgi:hypothetical protein